MHDPLSLVGTIPGPWLHRDYKGRLRLGKMIDVWHHDPSDYDSTTCGKNWRRHVHHYRLRFLPWFTLRRRFTRCEWCGQRGRKRDRVNVSYGGRDQRWWERERGLYHSSCLSVHSAHRACLCRDGEGGPWAYGVGGIPWGDCGTCGKSRAWRSDRGESPADITEAMFASVPVGQRPTGEQLELASRLWSEYRQHTNPAGVYTNPTEPRNE